MLVQQGTLKRGSHLVAGSGWAKVRSLLDDQGRTLAAATPSVAVEISGWKALPSAGDVVVQVKSEVRAVLMLAHGVCLF